MTFNIEAFIECSKCKEANTNFTEGYAPEDFEDFVTSEFEDAAIDYFKNHGWSRFGVTENWHCPNCQ